MYLMSGVDAQLQVTTGTSSVADSLSGNGGLTKSGVGTLILSGANTYTGGATVSGGTLQGNTTSLQGNIANDANVTFAQATDGTYSGAMSGTGSLTKTNAGVLTLSAANTYSGGTTVSGGTLQGNTTSLQGNVTNNASVTFDQAADGIYSGAMSGTGSLNKNGAGTLILSGANSYSGGTTVSDGSLAGSTTSLQGNITNNANVTFDQTNTGTYGGIISGTGTLFKLGTGTTILSGANTYSGNTTVSGGTLQGNTTSLHGNIVDNANVTFDQTTDGTYSSVISGTGSLIKSGTGTVTLSGANTYSGGTTVSAGSLVGNTTSLQGAITNNAVTTFDQSSSGTYSGAMSGAGSLIKSGTGTVALSGANMYSGGTTISGGSLVGTTTSLQGNFLDNANLSFNQNFDGTYAGIIGGTGNLTKSGNGTLTLSGVSTFSGGTTVSAGLLQGDTNTLQGDIANNAGVIFNQATSGIYAGDMSGTGTVEKDGLGTVTMTGTNTYTGQTTVLAGRLIVNGVITSPTIVAATPTTVGILAGIGTIEADVVSQGIVAPGSSIGTLTVNGDYTNTAEGIMEVEVDNGGNVPGVNNDLLLVTGTATLNGGLVSVQNTGGNYIAGTQYTFLQASSVVGTYAGITGDFNNSFIDAELGYTSNSVFFLVMTDYASVAQTINELAVANYLDSVASNPSADFQAVLAGLNSLSDSQARSAFNQMSGEVSPTLAGIGLQNTTLVIQQLAGQLRSGRLGSNISDEYAVAAPATSKPSGPISLVSYECGSAPRVVFVSERPLDQWRGWTFGYGLGGAASTDGNAAGLNYGMGGTLLGVERLLDDNGRVGFFGGYQGTSLRLTGPLQSGKINGGMLGTYLYNDDGFNYYTLIGGMQYNGFNTRRLVLFDGIDRTAAGSFSGWQGYGYLERGVSFRTAQATLQPFAALQYIYLRQNGYTETGADSLNLSVGGIDANSLRSLVGSRLQYTQGTRLGHRLLPELRALWLHEFLQTDAVVNSFFAPIGGGGFAIQGLNLGRDWAIVGGGFRCELNSGWNLYANYDAQVNTRQVFHVGSGGLQYAW